jgi:hypothetical protein
MTALDSRDLVRLVQSVFPPHPEDRILALLVDVPRSPESDNPDWKARRDLAWDWSCKLRENAADIPLEEVRLVAFPDVGSNNAELPGNVVQVSAELPEAAGGLAAAGLETPLGKVFEEVQIFLAPTEYSTTAPLKNAAKRYGFRAATMPGFGEKMIPALKIDYGEVARRVALLKEKLDRAERCDVSFEADGKRTFGMSFDLRRRSSHLSAGRFPDKGTAGNLPSGETYIVPYEGEDGESSRTSGVLPVEIKGEIVLFTVEANRAVSAEGTGPAAEGERRHLLREPAYGNMAELGFGVLGDFGLAPIGEILLDEKLGLHVAFGRSDHFGGRIGPGDFSSPKEVIHLDRIYIPATQPRIRVVSVDLFFAGSASERLMENGRYLVFD